MSHDPSAITSEAIDALRGILREAGEARRKGKTYRGSSVVVAAARELLEWVKDQAEDPANFFEDDSRALEWMEKWLPRIRASVDAQRRRGRGREDVQ